MGYVYLGKRVKDRGKKGLDSIVEVEDIAKAIVNDLKAHRISYRTAMSRMNLLELVVTKDSDFYGRKEKVARDIIDEYREVLKKLRNKRR
ncbi:conserved hypothetical protein [Pyrococcus abyssi virus 1]|uniref:hypothetical protein n=1 Tax=Pyrococcus abyssi virus 1 TaxID=425386 RepID=UPI00015529C3|nr:hypothetical protein PAV1_ORF89 [Pyrococcus abyssi virus 1]ABN58502.1 conserved hypothetical protein [Pyrococcus abyssi virus 1]